MEYSFLIVAFSYLGAYVTSVVYFRYFWPWIRRRHKKYYIKVSSTELALIQFSLASCAFLSASLVVSSIALVGITNEALGTSPAPGLTVGFSWGKDGLTNGLFLFFGGLAFLIWSYFWEFWLYGHIPNE
jgi:hypothetical protein